MYVAYKLTQSVFTIDTHHRQITATLRYTSRYHSAIFAVRHGNRSSHGTCYVSTGEMHLLSQCRWFAICSAPLRCLGHECKKRWIKWQNSWCEVTRWTNVRLQTVTSTSRVPVSTRCCGWFANFGRGPVLYSWICAEVCSLYSNSGWMLMTVVMVMMMVKMIMMIILMMIIIMIVRLSYHAEDCDKNDDFSLKSKTETDQNLCTPICCRRLVSRHSCGKGDNHQRRSEGSPLQRDLVLDCSSFFSYVWHLLTSLQFSKQEYGIVA